MIGNFCHDPLVINIKIDTKDALQKSMCTLQLIRGVPTEQGLGVGDAIAAKKITVY